MQTVRRSRQVECAGQLFREEDIVIGSNRMFVVTFDGKRTCTRRDDLSFAEERRLAVLRGGGVRRTVRQGVCAVDHEVTFLMALVVDRRTVGACQRQTVQRDVMTIRTVDGQLALTVTGEQIDDARTRDGRVDRYIAVRVRNTDAVVSARYLGRRTVPHDLNRVRPVLFIHRVIDNRGVDRRLVCAGRVIRRVLFCAGNHPDCQKHNHPNLFHTYKL